MLPFRLFVVFPFLSPSYLPSIVLPPAKPTRQRAERENPYARKHMFNIGAKTTPPVGSR